MSPTDMAYYLEIYNRLELTVFPLLAPDPSLPEPLRSLSGKFPSSTLLYLLSRFGRTQMWRKHVHPQLAGRNVAVRTGARFNLFVIDVDPKDGRDPLPPRWQLPKTLTVRTGSGYHLYFRPNPIFPVIPSTHCVAGNGLDIRGEFCYVVAPPSVHGTGSLYTFEDPDHPIATLPKLVAKELCACPISRFRQLKKTLLNTQKIKARIRKTRRSAQAR
jgi:hypothetical protein